MLKYFRKYNVIIIQRTKVSKRSIRIQPIFSKKFCEWNCLIVTVIVWCFETIRAPAGSGNCSCHSLWGSCDRVCLTPGSPSQRARPCNQIGSFTEYYQWVPLICGFLSYSKIKSLKKSQIFFWIIFLWHGWI